MADAKAIFAQTSSSVGRNRAEYRLAMKNKAIVELEFMPLLQQILAEQFNDSQIVVCKYGVDAELWFHIGRPPTGEPDYEATLSDGEKHLYEFQIADKSNLKFFDFKVSKIRKKKRNGEEIVHNDRKFFYVVRHEKKIGFISPSWIYENGEYGFVSAWRSYAYRVPRKIFLNKLREADDRLGEILEVVDAKKYLLDFQHKFITDQKSQLSSRLKRVVDENEKFEIVPNTIEGFFETCLIMNTIEGFPDNPDIWLIYLLTHLEREDLTPHKLAMIVFSIDFLYFGAIEKTFKFSDENQIYILRGVDLMESHIQRFTWNKSIINPRVSLLEQVRQMLFVVSYFEDWRQHVAYKWNSVATSGSVRKAGKIFEDIPDLMALKHWLESHLSET